ncbi:hypothetical protein BJ878DRAFT_571610 [Calycina marina]|uniref:Uncharacterized protein n=1 Tax=Calycina marina TaxID=1763456 RepID=A0A9P7YUS9_9HELO|nr:hypothetical protein BJ878DRAFT_571610 [Calycina marina]
MRANTSAIIIGVSETLATGLVTLCCIDGLAKMPYLIACLSESMRTFPQAPAGLLGYVSKAGEIVDGL